MDRFRRAAWPLGLLMLSWHQSFEEFNLFEPALPLSQEWWVFVLSDFSFYLATMGLIVWSLRGERPTYRTERKRFRLDSGQQVLLALLAASSMPNLLLAVIVADRIGIEGHQIFVLSTTIVSTPVFLGIIWFRYQDFAPALPDTGFVRARDHRSEERP